MKKKPAFSGHICERCGGRRPRARKCPECSRRAMDSANARAMREDDDDYDGPLMTDLHRTQYGQRLYDGFGVMHGEDDD